MMFRVAAAVWLAVPVACAGCGTVGNFTRLTPADPVPESVVNPPPPVAPLYRVYGGVRGDVAAVRALRWDQEYSFLNYAVAPVLALDILFSFAGDTVTLPYTLGHAVYTAARPALPSGGPAPR